MKELRHWPTLAANAWPILGEKHWPSLGENTWPSIARKMTVPGNVQAPQSFNPYHYAFNNPVNRTDPSGLYPPPPPPLPPASGGGPGDRFSSPTMEFALGWVKGHAGDFIRYANEYGIPAELPAGLLAAEIDLDHTLPGRTLDDMARMANLMRQFSCFWPSYLSMPMLVSMGLVGSEAYWEVVSTIDTYKVFGKDLGDVVSGDSASHHATYVIVEEYMTENYGKPLPYGTEKSAYLPCLLTDQGSIEFTARMARMLADYRKGSKSPHGREDLSLDDMAQIWGAWRAGINEVTCFGGSERCGFEDLSEFQNKKTLGDEAQLARPHFRYCREYFTSKNKHPK